MKYFICPNGNLRLSIVFKINEVKDIQRYLRSRDDLEDYRTMELFQSLISSAYGQLHTERDAQRTARRDENRSNTVIMSPEETAMFDEDEELEDNYPDEEY